MGGERLDFERRLAISNILKKTFKKNDLNFENKFYTHTHTHTHIHTHIYTHTYIHTPSVLLRQIQSKSSTSSTSTCRARFLPLI